MQYHGTPNVLVVQRKLYPHLTSPPPHYQAAAVTQTLHHWVALSVRHCVANARGLPALSERTRCLFRGEVRSHFGERVAESFGVVVRMAL